MSFWPGLVITVNRQAERETRRECFFPLTPGRQMGRPDALLRWVDHPRGADDNADLTLLTPEVFELRVMEAIMLEGKEAAFMEWI